MLHVWGASRSHLWMLQSIDISKLISFVYIMN